MNSNQPFVDQIAGYQALATPASGQPLDGAGYDALLGLLYDGITDADGFNSFLQAFCTVFGCFTATLSIQDRALGRLLGGWFPGMPEAAVEWYLTHLVQRDPLIEAVLNADKAGFHSTRRDLPVVIDEDSNVSQWRATLGCDDAASALVYRDGHRAVFFTLTRETGSPAFSDSELALFDRFLPHLRRAMVMHEQLINARRPLDTLVSAIDQLGQPVLVFNTSFRVVHANRSARQYLDQNQLMWLQDDYLLFRDRQYYAEFSAKLVQIIRASLAAAKTSEATMMLKSGSRQPGVSLVMNALFSDQPRQQQGGGALVTLYPWNRRLVVETQELQRFFDLTPMEAQVCAALCRGDSLETLSTSLRREQSTLRSHLKAAFRKTGTSRQAELVALMLSQCYRFKT